MDASQRLAMATVFVWLGLVVAISFVEAPLKFRAPGVTLPLGLGIGRLVFRALNTVEVVLAIALMIALLTNAPGAAGWTLLVVTSALLATQTVLLRPRLDRRARQIIAGRLPPPSRLLHRPGMPQGRDANGARSHEGHRPNAPGPESPSRSTTSRENRTTERHQT